MAVSEWGPKSIPQGNRFQVVQFSGEQLQDVSRKVTGYLNSHDGATRAEAVLAVSRTHRESPILETGLDILNQLSVVNRNGHGVRSVTVFEDIDNIVSHGPATGKPHMRYSIDWISDPRQQEIQDPRQSDTRVNTPVVRQEQPVGRRSRRQEEKENKRKADEERRELVEQRREVDNVIIDTVREIGEQAIEFKNIKIELNAEGTAEVYFKPYLEYHKVDRQTGTYHQCEGEHYAGDDPLYVEMRSYTSTIDPQFVPYFNVLAEQAEGKEATYMPNPLDFETCKTVFEQANELGMIKVKRNKDEGVYFEYMTNPVYGLTFSKMDLENGIVPYELITIKHQRPIHPDFLKFLNLFKSGLEKQQT